MKNNVILVILLNITFLVVAKRIKIECPSYCSCETHLNLKKAQCVNRTIVVADLDLPPQTQILDVSFNQISQLKENAFFKNKLLQLQLLNMSHNRLGEISIFAFKGLKKLKVLDLSHNGIQQIYSQWFEVLIRLEYLYLKGNHFGDMSKLQRHAFNSEKLKVLDLSESYITFINGKIFNLPQLNYLDLSSNKLISLNQEVIIPLRNLKIFNMKDNLLACNKEMINLKKSLDSKNIRYDEDPCERKIGKFEKMIMKAPTETYNENNFWIVDDTHETPKKIPVTQNPCQNIQKDNSMIQLSELPYSLFIITVLIYGILIGLVCGCSVKSCRMRHKIRHYKGKSTVRLKRIKFLENEAQQLTSHEGLLGTSTPILIRK
ncbi:leucine-rich repeat and transmembrane domain-containing protein 1-like [Coccinella septempunctata]|uniref:leucine-rich repeat and transmembrane domain-containing protein 1-like n=1 Tax=Coccinella septempunctata TaxID=41139 RepID=UPI001D088D77|nr:leucine-rich repeat and transmembrane domain-containing protein 1-like [Coccinella septempunctata]